MATARSTHVPGGNMVFITSTSLGEVLLEERGGGGGLLNIRSLEESGDETIPRQREAKWRMCMWSVLDASTSSREVLT